MAKEVKTNVMRMLEKAQIPYAAHFYEHEDGAIDGVSVAQKLGQPKECVYKTLVTRGADKNYYIFVIPVEFELNLKAAAKAVGVKSVEMIPVADINRVTGYIRGGCSPVGMKKQYRTVLHKDCIQNKTIIVSGGKIGTQVELEPDRLIQFIGASTADLVEQ